MADELSQAISFVNGYFVLADGLVPDLVDHLAEDVVLDWFGHTIIGRVNVATFMKDKKTSSRHIFNEVNPVTTIGYRKQRPFRSRKYYSIDGTHKNGALIRVRSESDDDKDKYNDENYPKKYKRQCFSDRVTIRNSDSIIDEDSDIDDIHDMEVDESDSEVSSRMHDQIDKRNILETSNMMQCNLNFEKLALEDDVTIVKPKNLLSSDVFKHVLNEFGDEITLKTKLKPTNVHEIEKKIIQLKNKKITTPLSFSGTEIGQGDGSSVHDFNSIKYVEACGVIEFSRFFNTNQIRKDIRKRFSRLQIAYSVKDKDSMIKNENLAKNVMEMDENKVGRSSKDSSKLKSLKELRQLNHNLIPRSNKNDFSTDDEDYNDDALNERNKFLKKLNFKSMNDNEDENMHNLVTPKYVRHYLTPEKNLKRVMAGRGDIRGFVFNYLIHLIIYENNTQCRLNLSHEFESKELSDE